MSTAHASHERVVYLDDLPRPANWIETEQPICIDVVGMAQAGKSTFCKIIDTCIEQQGAMGGNFNVPISTGFRGLAAHVIQANGLPFDEPVRLPADTYTAMRDNFIAKQADIYGLLHDAYVNPADEETVLRSPAVDSVVALTSESPAVLSLLHQVGGNYLAELIKDPSIAGLSRMPATLLMDARNRQECQEKFAMAGLCEALSVVLECPESIAAERAIAKRFPQLPRDSEEFITRVSAKTTELEQRNLTDRRRTMGKMTLADDIAQPRYLRDLLQQDAQAPPDQESPLFLAGAALAYNPDGALVVHSNRVSKQDEAYGLELVLHGALERTLNIAN